jgi:hypothetical protein
MLLRKKFLFIHEKFQINFLIPVMLNFFTFEEKSDTIYTFLQKKLNQNTIFNEIFALNLKNLAHWNHFFNDHKTITNNNFQNLIRRKLSNDEFLNIAVIVPNAPTQEKQNKFLPTDASFRILGRNKEVVSLHDSAVGSGQPTEIKTKNLGNLRLDIETDLKDFEEENSSRRIRESPGATTPEQQQGSLARKNYYFCWIIHRRRKENTQREN